MNSTNPTGTHRVCYQCDNHAQSGSMFCAECLPERMPPIIREKPPKPPRRSLWTFLSGLLRLRSHSRNLSRRIIGLESDLSDMQQANVALRKRCKDLKTQLQAMTQAFDECDEERSKLARKITESAIAWAPVAQIAKNALGNHAQMPAIASFVVNRLNPPRVEQNAIAAVSRNSEQSAAPLGQNPETEIAPGHNPDRVTVAQVGKGWMLLENGLTIFDSFPSGEIEWWSRITFDWHPAGNQPNFKTTYRVRI